MRESVSVERREEVDERLAEGGEDATLAVEVGPDRSGDMSSPVEPVTISSVTVTEG